MALLQTTTIGGISYGTIWVGMIAPFGTSSVPADWLVCDGAAVSRSTYSDLFTTIGTTWGSGDGNTTFNVPNFRGEFVRGWDDGRGVDSGRNLASTQDDCTQGGMYGWWTGSPHTGNSYCGPGHARQQIKHPGYPNAYGGVQPSVIHNGGWYHINCGVGYGHSRLTTNTGRNEYTDRNYSAQYCIKY